MAGILICIVVAVWALTVYEAYDTGKEAGYKKLHDEQIAKGYKDKWH